MAGLGFKDFQVGEVLTSSDVDGYLMQQTVMRFADSGARGSALGTATGTAVALAEGMVSYLDNANALQVYDGTNWVGVGGVRQVVQTVSTAAASTNSSTFANIISATITPISSNSKILVLADVKAGTNTNIRAFFKILRGSTDIYIGDAASSRTRVSLSAWVATGAGFNGNSIIYLDSPSTTSSTTYNLAWASGSNGDAVYLNRDVNDADASTAGRAASSLTLIEVA